MKLNKKTLLSALTSFLLGTSSVMGSDEIKAVNPDISPEAQSLLKYLYSISGTYTLIGQHNYPNTQERNSQFAAAYFGKTPVLFSTDMGFAKEGDKDSYCARPEIIEVIKKQHQQGAIITICWHAVPPTADEPVQFSASPGTAPNDLLASVQGQLQEQQYKDVLTPGTKLYKRWCAQVDTIAGYLKQLQDARIPVLWRPYHEMNGKWFWWGGRIGNYGTATLYRQLYHRFVRHHKLNNLLWVWSVDRPVEPEMRIEDFYPGDEYLDIVSLDVYRNDFQQSYYDNLAAISKGKPLILAEVGNPPNREILKKQPKWAAYIVWAGMVRNTMKKEYAELLRDQRILGMEDTAYQKTILSYHSVCGIAPFLAAEKKSRSMPVDFSGTWIFDEEKSTLDFMGTNAIPYKMDITQKKDSLLIRKEFILEYTENSVTTEKILLNGKESISEMWDAPKTTTAAWSETKDTLIFESTVAFKRSGQVSEMRIKESWSIQDSGRVLTIHQYIKSVWGERTITILFHWE